MNVFLTFASALTFAYIVYYSVMICIELYSKPKEKRDESESFELDDIQEEQPVAVASIGEEIRIIKGNSDEIIEKDTHELVAETEADKTGEEKTSKQWNVKFVDIMDEIEPENSFSMDAIEFETHLKRKAQMRADHQFKDTLPSIDDNEKAIDRI